VRLPSSCGGLTPFGGRNPMLTSSNFGNKSATLVLFQPGYFTGSSDKPSTLFQVDFRGFKAKTAISGIERRKTVEK
jgi:hypothetical protein